MKSRYYWDSNWNKTSISSQNLRDNHGTPLASLHYWRPLRKTTDHACDGKRLYFLIPKGVNLHVRAWRVTWPQVQLKKMLFMLDSWQTGINGIILLLHNTSAQSYCLIPDLDRSHLGGKSATVIHSCWFNKLHNRLHSRPHWSPTQKDVSLQNFPKLYPTEGEGLREEHKNSLQLEDNNFNRYFFYSML